MTDVKAVEVSEVGGPEVLRVVEMQPDPLPDGHVRVSMAFAGVNFVDTYERAGRYPRALPYIPGDEGSGQVTEVAADVADPSVGDRVAWQGVRGSYAELVVAPAERLLPVPGGLTDEQAAAIPVQGLTAHYLAVDSYPIQPGDTVVVHAGAGGVGLLLTQIAKLRGADVITTTSTADKAELSRGVGADVVTTYDEIDDTVHRVTEGRGVAAVYDGVGLATFGTSLRLLARRGTLVLFGASSGKVPPFDPDLLRRGGSLTVTRPTLRDFVTNAAELRHRAAQLFEWLSESRLRVHVGAVYPLGEAAQAHQDLESRATYGKLLLKP